MPRPVRIEYPGAWYHVINRGLASQPDYLVKRYRPLFLEVLAEMTEICQVQCHAYCLVGNEYHLLLRTTTGNLSTSMKYLNAVYTQRFNRRESREGPFFKGRYKAVVIDPIDYLLPVSRYIHRMPTEKGHVQQPQRYRWSSYRCYLGIGHVPHWLTMTDILDKISRSTVPSYQHYVDEGVDPDVTRFYHRQRQAPILGSLQFRQMFRDPPAPRSPPSEQALVCLAPSMIEIVRVCAAHFGTPAPLLLKDGRAGAGQARSVAIAMCRSLGGYSLKEISEFFRDISPIGVSSALTRVKTLRRERPEYHRLLHQIENDITARTSRRIMGAVPQWQNNK